VFDILTNCYLSRISGACSVAIFPRQFILGKLHSESKIIIYSEQISKRGRILYIMYKKRKRVENKLNYLINKFCNEDKESMTNFSIISFDIIREIICYL